MIEKSSVGIITKGREETHDSNPEPKGSGIGIFLSMKSKTKPTEGQRAMPHTYKRNGNV